MFYRYILAGYRANRGNETKLLSIRLGDKERAVLIRKGWKIAPEYRMVRI